MILKSTAIQLILDNPAVSLALASKLKFTQTWIRELARVNRENSPLTTMAAVQVIREETGLLDSEILEEREPVAAK